MDNSENIIKSIKQIFCVGEDNVASLVAMLSVLDKNNLLNKFSKYDIKSDYSNDDILAKANIVNALLEFVLENPNWKVINNDEKKKLITELCKTSAALYEQVIDTIENHDSWKNLQCVVMYSMLAYIGDYQTVSDIHIKNYCEKLINTQNTVHNMSLTQQLEYSTFYIIVVLLSNLKNYEGLSLLNKDIERANKLLEEAQNEQINKEAINFADCLRITAYGNIIYMIILIKEYLFSGRIDSSENQDIYSLIDMYSYNAFHLLENESVDLRIIGHLIRYALHRVVENSIWNIAEKSPLIRKFINENLSGNERYFYTLLPSQRDSISDVLTPKKSIVVGMPTSSGKSFLAEMQILFSIHNYTTEDFQPTVCYVVPTNSLISQVRADLQNDFKSFGFKIETALPCYDIDEIENEFLSSEHIDILISTPEKLEALVRQNHKSIQNTRLVILDEAHNLSDNSRGSKFELVLSVIKQNLKEANFLLLSPFIKNADDINEWLADSPRDAKAITVEWSPTKQYIGCNLLNTKKTESYISFYKSARNYLKSDDIKIKLLLNPQDVKAELNEQTVGKSTKLCVLLNNFIEQEGNVLVLCGGRGTSVKLAVCLKDYFSNKKMLPDISMDKDVQRAIEIIKLEVGEDDPLINCLRKGVCFHNSGLSIIVKETIEELVRLNKIKIIVATTTLAQGMNFPINTVVFDTINMGNNSRLSSSEFWNIAGRAGRAYKDKEGYIILSYSSSNDKTIELVKSYIEQDLRDVVSSLNNYFTTDSIISFDYNYLKDPKNGPILNLLQYINHIVNISYDYNINYKDITKIRSILTDSYLYHSLTKQDGYIVAQKKLNDFVSQYIEHINKKNKRDLARADELGISDISFSKVRDIINAYIHELKEYGDDSYKASEIILQTKDVEKLTRIIEIIAKIPEIRIDMKGQGRLDAESIAKLLLGWVNGDSIRDITQEIVRPGQDYSEVMALCNQYLNSKMKSYMPWGINVYQAVSYDIQSQNAKMLPSYIYYGVSSKEAVIVSKLGVPRFAVSNVLDLLSSRYKDLPIDIAHMKDIKQTISQLSANDFDSNGYSGTVIKEIIDKRLI